MCTPYAGWSYGCCCWRALGGASGTRLRRPPQAGKFSTAAAGPVHLALYVLLFVIPIIGIVTFIWHGRNLDLGLFQVNFGVRKNPAVFHPTESAHRYLAYGLFALAGIHALAGLWHHFVRRDDVLRRMWPTST
jgi:cytochrome b561